MRFQKRKRNKILPDDFVQFFSRAKSGPVKGEKVEKHWSLQDFKAIHQKVIDDIKNTTKYLKNDDVKDKVRDKIIKTNYIIKTHWKYISDKETRMRAQLLKYEDKIAKYEMAKLKYITRRDFLKGNKEFQNMLNEADQEKQGVITSMKRIISSKVSPKKWAKHSEDYISEKNSRAVSEDRRKSYEKSSRESLLLSSALDTLTKAEVDMPELERKLNARIEMPRRQNPIIQQFNDLVSKCDQTVQKIDRDCKQQISGQSELVDILVTELMEYDLINDIEAETEEDRIFGDLSVGLVKRTAFGKAIEEYKKFRGKVIPLVEEEDNVKCTLCMCM